jgi:Mg-chelatase subunit ChlD
MTEHPSGGEQHKIPLRQRLRERGITLEKISWGNRDLFTARITELETRGLFGGRGTVREEALLSALRAAASEGLERPVLELLSALLAGGDAVNRSPGLLSRAVELGLSLARARSEYGSLFFRLLGQGRLGTNPAAFAKTLEGAGRLLPRDPALSLAFLKGCGPLTKRLSGEELHRFIDEGLRRAAVSSEKAQAFLACETESAERLIAGLSSECRLSSVADELTALIAALSGHHLQIESLEQLDSDTLMERETRLVCVYNALYLPQRICTGKEKDFNRSLYLLSAVCTAGIFEAESFSAVHGRRDYPSCASLAPDDPVLLNLFQITEYLRVLKHAGRRRAGFATLLERGLALERDARKPPNSYDTLFLRLAGGRKPDSPTEDLLTDIAERSGSFTETMDLLAGRRELLAGFSGTYFRHPFFLPDFLYPAVVQPGLSSGEIAAVPPPAEAAGQDGPLRKTAGRIHEEHTDSENSSAQTGSVHRERRDHGPPALPAYSYPEWDFRIRDYYSNYCHLYELRETKASNAEEDAIGQRASRRERRAVRRLFESFRPDTPRFEKYQYDGEEIDHEVLVEYLSRTKRDPYAKRNFYQKLRVRERDLAVLVLMDVSGSTAEEIRGSPTLSLEKRACAVLAEGLAALGDRCALGGFDSDGRDNCRYYPVKEFDEAWDRQAEKRLYALSPGGSTRLGPALRHCGRRLSLETSTKKLLLLISDGKPQDEGYSPENWYAHYDVRRACTENDERGVQTFALLVDDTDPGQGDVMFPGGRYTVIADVHRLAVLLPKIYLSLTF